MYIYAYVYVYIYMYISHPNFGRRPNYASLGCGECLRATSTFPLASLALYRFTKVLPVLIRV